MVEVRRIGVLPLALMLGLLSAALGLLIGLFFACFTILFGATLASATEDLGFGGVAFCSDCCTPFASHLIWLHRLHLRSCCGRPIQHHRRDQIGYGYFGGNVPQER